MERVVIDAAVVAGVAFVVVVIMTPGARLLSRLLGAVDQPGERRVHTDPTPRLGGLAILIGILAAVGAARMLDSFEAVFETTSDTTALMIAAALIVLVGVVDDTRGLPAPIKLAGQVLAAGALALQGVTLRYVYLPWDGGTIVALDPDAAALLTVVIVVAMINAVNLVDGLDGLAAGIVAIAAAALFVYAQTLESLSPVSTASATLILAGVVGSCLGFLGYNRHPASIFMGDSGAMLLGLCLAAAGVSAIGSVTTPGRSDFAALSIPVLVPALVLAIPFLDTVFAIVRRTRQGRPMFSPDKAHLHHRLVAIGHSHGRAVAIMWVWSALLAFAAVGVSIWPLDVVLPAAGVGAAIALAVVVGPRLGARIRRRRAPEPDPGLVIPFTKNGARSAKTRSDLRKRP